jgi:hypothetical protein
MVSYRPPREKNGSPDPAKLRVVPAAKFEEQMENWKASFPLVHGQKPIPPDWVPYKIRLIDDVHSDASPWHIASMAKAGEYDCRTNVWGAMSVIADDGEPLGIRPDECEVLMFRVNLKKLMDEVRERTE